MQTSFFGSSGFGLGLGQTITDSERKANAEREQAKRAAEFEARRAEQESRERSERRRQENRQRERQGRRDEYRAYSRSKASTMDPYTVLGLGRSASSAEIRKAWIALVKQHHPDHGGDAAKFREIQAAYEMLRAN